MLNVSVYLDKMNHLPKCINANQICIYTNLQLTKYFIIIRPKNDIS